MLGSIHILRLKKGLDDLLGGTGTGRHSLEIGGAGHYILGSGDRIRMLGFYLNILDGNDLFKHSSRTIFHILLLRV